MRLAMSNLSGFGSLGGIMTTATTAVPTATSVSGLVRTFGRTRALDGLELTVRRGEVDGFPGPNGAGKATIGAAAGDGQGPRPRAGR